MRSGLTHLALCCALPLAGCAGVSTLPPSPVTPNLSGNWQIQPGTAITPAPTPGLPFLAGALQVNGSQATATFTGSSLVCGDPQVATYTGTFNSATGALTLNAGFAQVQLAVPADPTTSASTGTLGAEGTICALAFLAPAVGIEIPPLSGVFTGTLATTAPSAPSTGTATLTLTQSATLNANGQFPLTGTLGFTTSGCGSSTTALTGAISGAAFSLASAPAGSPPLSAVAISGADNLGGSTLSTVNVSFAAGPCNSGAALSYAGNLALQ